MPTCIDTGVDTDSGISLKIAHFKVPGVDVDAADRGGCTPLQFYFRI